jgi:hypothetical protein
MRQAWFALLLLCATVGAGEVRVDCSCIWEDKDGYTPIQIRVEALIAPVEVQVEAQLGDSRASDLLRAQPGQVALRTVLVPSSGGWGTPIVRWSSSGGDHGETSVSVTNDNRSVDLLVLDPREQVPLPQLVKLIADEVGTGSGSSRGGYRSSSGDRARRVAADVLPDRWQAWPAWVTLLTTPEGEALLNPSQREAIATWTRMGGSLFTTDAAAAAAWRRMGIHAQQIDPASTTQTTLLARLRAAANEDGRPAEHPVPGTDQVPTAWFLTLAIAFAIVAGPLNLWWTMRRRQPFLLLVSTPLISVGTCILLIAIALMSDGIGRRRSAAQIVLLDQTAQRVSAFSAVTWFCGIAPGTFDLDVDDRALPMDAADWDGGWRRDRPDLGLDWRHGQRADSGWIPARVNRQLAFTQARPERRRISISRAAGGWRLGNGLDVTIRELHWCDASGGIWQASGISSGQDVALTPSRTAAPTPSDILQRLGLDARLALAGVGHEPGTFLAQLDAPLLPLPGPSAEDVGAIEAWIAGRLDIATPGRESF